MRIFSLLRIDFSFLISNTILTQFSFLTQLLNQKKPSLITEVTFYMTTLSFWRQDKRERINFIMLTTTDNCNAHLVFKTLMFYKIPTLYRDKTKCAHGFSFVYLFPVSIQYLEILSVKLISFRYF